MRRLLLVLVVLLAVLCGGLWLGGHPSTLPGFLRGPFVDDQTAIVSEAIDRVHDTYYRSIGRDTLADQSIAGLVAGLDDRFSNYFTPLEYRRFQQSQRSEFSGIGVTVGEDPKGLRIAKVFDGSPAARAKLHSGDVIVAVGPRSLKGVKQQASTALIKGPPGSDVKLTVAASGKRRRLTLTRATVTVPAVSSKLRTAGGRKIGDVALAQFGPGDHALVYAALRRLQRRGAKAYVFDLRGNGGGLVSEAQLIASAFLTDGPIVTTRGRSVPTRTLRATGEPVLPKAPVVVLVDRGTASASEIVTGALQDRDRATVVGTRTFGKGVFQEVIELSNGGALDITAGQYFTPKGRNLGGKGVHTGTGIKPDVAAVDDPKTRGRDEGLDVALRTAAKLPGK